jgi:hypothetical protein
MILRRGAARSMPHRPSRRPGCGRRRPYRGRCGRTSLRSVGAGFDPDVIEKSLVEGICRVTHFGCGSERRPRGLRQRPDDGRVLGHERRIHHRSLHHIHAPSLAACGIRRAVHGFCDRRNVGHCRGGILAGQQPAVDADVAAVLDGMRRIGEAADAIDGQSGRPGGSRNPSLNRRMTSIAPVAALHPSIGPLL